jgi:glycosyltransferase involved in cell wall biosynthesis
MASTDFACNLNTMFLYKKRMKLGVAIPCYINHIPHCKRLLDNLEQQSRRPDKVVVCCSSSKPDDFIVREYPFPVQIITTENKQNAAVNRNQLIPYMDTDIVCFFDADDDMHPQRLEIIAHTFETQKTDLVVHSYFHGQECGTPYLPIQPCNFVALRNVLEPCYSGCLKYDYVSRIHHSQVSVSQYALQVRFPEEIEWQAREDSIFCNRVSRLPNVQTAYLPICLSKYYISGSNNV